MIVHVNLIICARVTHIHTSHLNLSKNKVYTHMQIFSSFIKCSLKWIQNSNVLNACLFNLVSNLEHDKKKPNWIEAINFRFWSVVFVPFQYTEMRGDQSFEQANRIENIYKQHTQFVRLRDLLFFFCAPSHTYTLHLNNIKRQMDNNTRARVDICNLSDNWHESQWDIQWLND